MIRVLWINLLMNALICTYVLALIISLVPSQPREDLMVHDDDENWIFAFLRLLGFLPCIPFIIIVTGIYGNMLGLTTGIADLIVDCKFGRCCTSVFCLRSITSVSHNCIRSHFALLDGWNTVWFVWYFAVAYAHLQIACWHRSRIIAGEKFGWRCRVNHLHSDLFGHDVVVVRLFEDINNCH